MAATNPLFRERWWLPTFDLWETRTTAGGGAWAITRVTDHLEVTKTGGVAGNAADADWLENGFGTTTAIWKHSYVGNGNLQTHNTVTLPLLIPIEFELTTWPTSGGNSSSMFLWLARLLNSSYGLVTSASVVILGRSTVDLRITFNGTGSSISLATGVRYHALLKVESGTLTLTLWQDDGTWLGEITLAGTFSAATGFRIGAQPFFPANTTVWPLAASVQLDIWAVGLDDSFSGTDSPSGRELADSPISADGGLYIPSTDSTPSEWALSAGTDSSALIDDYDGGGSIDSDSTYIQSPGGTPESAGDAVVDQWNLPNYGGSLEILTIGGVWVSKDISNAGANHGRGFNTDGTDDMGLRCDLNFASGSYEWIGLWTYRDEADALWAIDSGAPTMPNAFVDRHSPGGITERRLTAVAVFAEEYDSSIVIGGPPPPPAFRPIVMMAS